jgi:gliding motility-associated-like protein
MRIIISLIIVAALTAVGIAQPVNDHCGTAIHLPNTDNWCSAAGAYSNINATPHAGAPIPNNCFLDLENEVWFTFIPNTPALYIRVTGAAQSLGTLRGPSIAVYEGTCSNLVRRGCNISSTSTNQVELSVDNLTIGAVYYLLVEGQSGNEGTFQICLEGFIPPPNPQSDCDEAVVLCDKSPFVVDTLLGVGSPDPGVTNTCIGQEFSSAWYKWTCEISGTLTFTLTPNNYQPGFESDDIDFVVYELPNGIDNCSGKVPVRCMAAGANVGESFQSWSRCNGPTGLREGDPDQVEPAGCQQASQNSFLAPLQMEAGKSYALLVNNFSQSGLGFSIDWGGTGTFQGPDPGFDVTAVQAFECDKTIIFDNTSTAPTDPIVAYHWNFGAGAIPLTSNDQGPINVIYDSFGEKRVALTVESSKGCVVTEILDFYIEPCCADTSTLDVTANIQDQICPGTASGVIQGVGISGAPAYQFSLDCENYQPSTIFPSLMPGSYTLCIVDRKGCEAQVDVVIDPATEFGVDIFQDTIFVQLGFEADINSVAFPTLPTAVSWTNAEYLTFFGSDIESQLNPTALPPVTGWYEVTIVNDAGCIAKDSVLIIVDPYKPIYIPNVITANSDFVNDRVTVHGNVAATGVDVFQIFDRWGGLLWERSDFELNDPSLGWDGTFKGQPVNPGVYAYRAVVNFLDGNPGVYTGTVTVLR